MATKIDRALWQAVWGKKSRLNLTPAQFNDYLTRGASPWTCYPNQDGRMSSVLEGLCSGDRADFSIMLSSWIANAAPLTPPPGHPSLLDCLPPKCSLLAIDKLMGAGMAAPDDTSLAAFVQRGINQDCIESEEFWCALGKLQDWSNVPLSSLRLPGCVDNKDTLRALCGDLEVGLLPDAAMELLLSDCNWDLSWTGTDDYSHWTRVFLLSALRQGQQWISHLDQIGVDWTGVDQHGNNLAHLLSSRTMFDMTGREILPVEGLRACLSRGVDFRAENTQDWTVIQRINAIKWANEDELAPLLADLAHQKLSAGTPSSTSRTPNRRI